MLHGGEDGTCYFKLKMTKEARSAMKRYREFIRLNEVVCVLHQQGLHQLFLRLHTRVFNGRSSNMDTPVRRDYGLEDDL